MNWNKSSDYCKAAFVYCQHHSTNWMIIIALMFIKQKQNKQKQKTKKTVSNDITNKLRSSFTAMHIETCKVKGKRLNKRQTGLVNKIHTLKEILIK
jgi:hypothetical protein